MEDKLKHVFEEAINTMNALGFENNDWAVHGKHALRFDGFKVYLRKKHINLIINTKKVPWKIEFLNFVETMPPIHSDEMKTYLNFHEKTKYNLDITPVEEKIFKELEKKELSLVNKKILYLSPLSVLKIREIKIEKSTPDFLGKEKGKRLLNAIQALFEQATKKNNEKIVFECERIINKFDGQFD